MPGTMTPGQMFDHELDAIKGWPSPYAVDYSAELHTPSDYMLLQAGMAMYLDNTSGKFKIGIQNGAPTIFAWQSGDDFDANSDIGNTSGGHWNGLVALGAYELLTTEFVAGAYPPNTPLTAENAAGANFGKVKAGVIYADQICGIVSGGSFETNHGKSALKFWPVFIPPTP